MEQMKVAVTYDVRRLYPSAQSRSSRCKLG